MTIICGNCADVLAGFPADYVDLTVTSPPYDNLRDYNGFVFDFEPIARELYRVTKPGGVVVWVVADATINGSETGTSFRQALRFMEIGFNCETMIYEVAGTGAKGSNDYYWQSFEFMFVFSSGKPKASNRIADKTNSRAGVIVTRGEKTSSVGTRLGEYRVCDMGIRSNVWRYHAGNNGDGQTTHPAPFPEALARDHIISWSNPGDLILDPMCGSGTTLKMAKELGRNYIGIDISQEYCQLAQRRVDRARVPLFVPEPNGNETAQPEQLGLNLDTTPQT